MALFSQQKSNLTFPTNLFLTCAIFIFSCSKISDQKKLAVFDGGGIVLKEYVDFYLASSKFKPENWPEEQQLRKIVKMEALTKISKLEAESRGYRSDSSYIATFQKNESRLLFTKYMRLEFIDKVVSDSLVHKFYNEFSPQYHMFYIMRPFLPESSEAFKKSQKDTIEYVYRQLQRGQSFEKLAKRYSQDITSKNKGGDIGFIIPESMGDEILRAVMDTLKNNFWSQPVHGIGGYYILKKGETREVAVPPFAQVKDRIWKTLYRTHSHNIQNKVDQRMGEVGPRYNLSRDAGKITRLLQKLTAKKRYDAFDAVEVSRLDAADMNAALVTFSGGVIRTGDIFAEKKKAPENVTNFNKRLKSLTEQRVLALHAKDKGYGAMPEINEQLGKISDELLRMLLYKKEVKDVVKQQMADNKSATKQDFEKERKLREQFEDDLLKKYNFSFVENNFSAALKLARERKELQNAQNKKMVK